MTRTLIVPRLQGFSLDCLRFLKEGNKDFIHKLWPRPQEEVGEQQTRHFRTFTRSLDQEQMIQQLELEKQTMETNVSSLNKKTPKTQVFMGPHDY